MIRLFRKILTVDSLWKEGKPSIDNLNDTRYSLITKI